MSSRPKRRGYFLPGFIALVALLALGIALVGAGDLDHSAPHSLSGANMDQQLAIAIQAEQNASSQPTVSCPSSVPVRPGLRFTCTIGAWRHMPAQTLQVVEIDSQGHLRWSVGAPPIDQNRGSPTAPT